MPGLTFAVEVPDDGEEVFQVDAAGQGALVEVAGEYLAGDGGVVFIALSARAESCPAEAPVSVLVVDDGLGGEGGQL